MAEQRITEEQKASLAALVAQAEQAYDAMYEAPHGTSGHYSDAKEFYGEAISFAEVLGLKDKADEMRRRLAHIKAVYRSQFT